MHKRIYEFKNGEISFLVNVEWEGGRPLRMVVCKDCYGQNAGALIKEIVIDNPRVPATV